jgi:hypothetical protein
MSAPKPRVDLDITRERLQRLGLVSRPRSSFRVCMQTYGLTERFMLE